MRRLICAAIVVAMSNLACTGSHAVAVINRADAVIEQVQLAVGPERAGLGSIGPGVSGTFIFSGRLPREAIVEWKVGDQQHRATVDLHDVPHGFAGTILLEVMKDATVKKSLEDPIPGLRK